MTAIPNVILEAINSLKNTLKNIQEAFNQLNKDAKDLKEIGKKAAAKKLLVPAPIYKAFGGKIDAAEKVAKAKFDKRQKNKAGKKQ